MNESSHHSNQHHIHYQHHRTSMTTAGQTVAVIRGPINPSTTNDGNSIVVNKAMTDGIERDVHDTYHPDPMKKRRSSCNSPQRQQQQQNDPSSSSSSSMTNVGGNDQVVVEGSDTSFLLKKQLGYMYDISTGDVICDYRTSQPISINKILMTQPLQHDLSTRKGPGGKNLTYISGETCSRTLNEIFGFDGWNLTILSNKLVSHNNNLIVDGQYITNNPNNITSGSMTSTSSSGGGGNHYFANNNNASNANNTNMKHTVSYIAHVRVTHISSGTYKEDYGSGDATDRSLSMALSNACKGAITDAMKRAAKHFGDKLGNCTYTMYTLYTVYILCVFFFVCRTYLT